MWCHYLPKFLLILAVEVAHEKFLELNLDQLIGWCVLGVCENLQICLQATYLFVKFVNNSGFVLCFHYVMICRVSVFFFLFSFLLFFFFCYVIIFKT